MNKYRIKIEGKNTLNFIKILINKKINLYDIEESKDNIKVTISSDDYNKIVKLKTSYKITIINSYGVLKIKYLIQKYKYILSFLFIVIAGIIVLSNIVFQIEVVHQKEEIRELILNDLKEFGLKKYLPKISYQKKETIKNKILEKEKDKIEWLEIENIGTKYIVRVEERLLNKKEEDKTPRNVIAKKDGMVLFIEATTGEISKKKYDYVRKGEILISGTIKNKDREVAKVKADGKVLAETWYKITVTLPKVYHEETRTGKTHKSITFRLANKKISLPKKDKNISYETHDKVLLESRILPFKLVIEENYELKIIDKRFDINNSSKEAIQIATEKLNKKLKDSSSILDKKVLKKTIKNSTIIVEVFFKVQEDITDYENISSELKEGE